MCRLLAIIGKSENASALLEQFQILARDGQIPGTTPGHSDGWGMVGYQKGKMTSNERDPNDAYGNPGYAKAAKQISAAEADIIIGHLRKASVGNNQLENTHPFVFQDISFAQNGTLFESEAIPLQPDFVKRIRGTSDSEKIFQLVLQDASSLDQYDIQQSIMRSVGLIRQQFDYTALNLLICDGKRVWALREVNRKNRFVREIKLMRYYTLFLGTEKKSGAIIIASEKVKFPGIQWVALKNHEMIEISAGDEKTKPEIASKFLI